MKRWMQTFKEVMADVDRREHLCRSSPNCPECGTEQVQIMLGTNPAEWRCRHCKHNFVYEPAAQ